MAFVLDASVTVSWGLEAKDHVVADLALQRLDTEAAYVPAIWWFEVRNVLLINERRRRLTDRDTTIFLGALSGMNIEVDPVPGKDAVIALARGHRLTVYDASYLEVAVRRNLPLATLDKKLAAAAKSEGVNLLD